MGLAETPEEARTERPGVPQIALVSAPQPYEGTTGGAVDAAETTLTSRVFTTGRPPTPTRCVSRRRRDSPGRSRARRRRAGDGRTPEGAGYGDLFLAVHGEASRGTTPLSWDSYWVRTCRHDRSMAGPHCRYSYPRRGSRRYLEPRHHSGSRGCLERSGPRSPDIVYVDGRCDRLGVRYTTIRRQLNIYIAAERGLCRRCRIHARPENAERSRVRTRATLSSTP